MEDVIPMDSLSLTVADVDVAATALDIIGSEALLPPSTAGEAADEPSIVVSASEEEEDSQVSTITGVWVDYLPSQILEKRLSLDSTQPTDTTESAAEDWPDEYSLVGNTTEMPLLVSPDIHLQHELLLELQQWSSSHHHASNASTAVSPASTRTTDWHECRAQLEACMEKSQASRAFLAGFIQQRANLAQVLADIERSSRQVKTCFLADADMQEEDNDNDQLLALDDDQGSACLDDLADLLPAMDEE